MLVDGSPQPMLPAADADDDLIEMSFVSKCGQTTADLVGEGLSKLQRPLTHRFMADQNASSREHLFNHAQAQGNRKYNQTAWLITSAGNR